MHDHAGMADTVGTGLSDLGSSNDPTTALAHCPAMTSCLPITVLPIPGEGELARDLYSLPRIFVAHAGRGKRWYQLGARTRVLQTAPRMIEIYEGAGRSVLIQFADAEVQAITHGELARLDLRTQHELFDERVSSIALALAAEALAGLPNGRLYAQGLSVSLVGVLAARHAQNGEAPRRRPAGRFGPLQRQRLAELIEDQLGADLSLTRLAREAGLSPHHFLRVFKTTFGTTPHRYVQHRRIAAAVAALRRPGAASIADIALEHGFASQSHMTELMRRCLGATPGAFRGG